MHVPFRSKAGVTTPSVVTADPGAAVRAARDHSPRPLGGEGDRRRRSGEGVTVAIFLSDEDRAGRRSVKLFNTIHGSTNPKPPSPALSLPRKRVAEVRGRVRGSRATNVRPACQTATIAFWKT